MDQWKLVFAGGALTLAGVAVGAALFGSRPAVAQDAGFRECIIARQGTVDTNGDALVARADRAHTVLIPHGYVPIGGGAGSEATGAVVLCRR